MRRSVVYYSPLPCTLLDTNTLCNLRLTTSVVLFLEKKSSFIFVLQSWFIKQQGKLLEFNQYLSNLFTLIMSFVKTRSRIRFQIPRPGSGSAQKGPDPTGSWFASASLLFSGAVCNTLQFYTLLF
jgi:hypothetical protein